MSHEKKVLIVAGEPSGEVLGAELMHALRKQCPTPIVFSGVGGVRMKQQGLYPLFPMSDIALMGVAEIAPRLPNIFKRMNTTAKFVAQNQPDFVVLIDSPEFNLRLAKRIKKRCPNVPIALYVAPQVWASRPGRARKMSKFVDHIFALLPFEKPFFEAAGIPCTIVGHPVIERIKQIKGGDAFRARHLISNGAQIICLLPGSRLNEVKRLMPIFGDVAYRLREIYSDAQFVLPVVPHMTEVVAQQLETWRLQPHVVRGDVDKFAAFDASSLALAASGTVSLELALARVPTVIAYRVDPLTAFVARRIITSKYVNLVNLIVDAPAIPELLQNDCTADTVFEHARALLSSEESRQQQLAAMDTAMADLGLGRDAPSIRAADAMLAAFIEKGALH